MIHRHTLFFWSGATLGALATLISLAVVKVNLDHPEQDWALLLVTSPDRGIPAIHLDRIFSEQASCEAWRLFQESRIDVKGVCLGEPVRGSEE